MGVWRRSLLAWLVLCVVAVPFAFSSEGVEDSAAAGLVPGESMVFQARWGLFSKAGRVAVAAFDGNEQGDDRTRIRVDIASDGTLGYLFHYEASVESWFDSRTGRMVEAELRSASRSRNQHRRIEFDYAAGSARYTDLLEPRRSAVLELPPGDPMDLIRCVVQVRAWELTPGLSREVLVQADKRFYPIRVNVVGTETLRCALGEFRAHRLVPEPVGERRGIFRNDGGLTVWVEDSPRRLPLRIEARTRVGLVVADLVEYRAPGAAGATPVLLTPPEPPAPRRAPHRHRGA